MNEWVSDGYDADLLLGEFSWHVAFSLSLFREQYANQVHVISLVQDWGFGNSEQWFSRYDL